MLSDRSELFLVPQGSWRGAKRGGGSFLLVYLPSTQQDHVPIHVFTIQTITEQWKGNTYTQEITVQTDSSDRVIARNSTSSIGSYRIWSRDKRRPGALRRGSLAGVRCWSHPPRTHRAPGKQPADRKSSPVKHQQDSDVIFLTPESADSPSIQPPPSETHTHTNTHLHFLLRFGYISCNCMQLAKTFLLKGLVNPNHKKKHIFSLYFRVEPHR